MKDQLIETFIEKWLDFDLQLREKRGINEALHEELIELLKRIQLNLEGKDTIPKNLADVFLDMWGAMTSSGEMYDEDVRSEIYMAADSLTDHARQICNS
jgi:hypothetical protein